MSDSDRPAAVICQRCGGGFVFTTGYHDFLRRRGVKVTTPMLCMTCFLKTGPLPKQRGQVKWFDARKRYGFISTGEGQDVFFHQQHILAGKGNRPREGRGVRFHVHHTPKGPEAWNVELV